jgi:hypothetical protein
MTNKLVGSSKHAQNPDQIRILEATLLKTAWCFAIFKKKELGDKIDSF